MMAAEIVPAFAPPPGFRGRLQRDSVLAPQTWFRVGGVAEWLARPIDAEDLAALLAALPATMSFCVLGAASNVIIRDGGIPDMVIRLGRGFGGIAFDDGGVVAGAAVLDATLAEAALAAGRGGLEFLAGIPGTVGGAVAMNAGCYGSEIASVLDWADIALAGGETRRLQAADLAFAYRHAALPAGAVVMAARLRTRADAPAAIAARMAEIRAQRVATQPLRARTGGSTFRNPPAAESTLKAWELIEAAGCRGLRLGAAQVSEQHCNFLINTGGARAAEIEGLGEMVRARVLAATGVSLAWEIRRLGVPEGRR
ncbi:MAG: UDP-N-acetylmuramate dehydrogenase [Acidibrevibacterium sp.]|uniref:UDP-N-acetylmuramate dehydrogenase n=1 Tax=Acidibrevibacterium sp. TaxID=2606776 RepID=UPI003D00C290